MSWNRSSRRGLADSLFVVLLGSALAAGCGESHAGGPDAGSGSSEAGDGSGAAGSGGRMGVAGRSSPMGRGGSHAPVETTFVLRNDGDDALVLGSNCGMTWPSLYEQDNQLGFANACSCPCENRSACGCPAACLNTQQLVVPGTRVSKSWDGVALDYSTDSSRSCYVKRVPAPGAELKADACWNYGDRGMPEGCSDEAFAYGRDTEVMITAKPMARGPIKTKIGLNNTSDAPIYVVTQHCGAQTWFRLDMGENIAISTFCPCACEENFGRANCPVCGPCAEDVIEAVPPGATISFDWDSGFWYRYASGCSKRYTMPLGSRIKVQLCWSKTRQDAPTCQTSYVDVGSEMVLAGF